MYRIRPLFIFFLCFGFFAGKAAADTSRAREIPEIKQLEFMPEEEFKAKTQLVEMTPMDDEYLAFQVRLPKKWKVDENDKRRDFYDAGLATDVLTPLTRIVSPPNFTLRSFFTLEATELDYEINVKNWFINYTLINGYSLEGMSELDYKTIKAIYVEVDGDITYVVHARVSINGPRVIIARYYVPQELYREQKVMQQQALASFELKNPQTGTIEDWKSYAFLDQSYVDYPASWSLDPTEILSLERMKALFYSMQPGPESLMRGQVNLYLTSKLMDVSLSDEIKRFQDTFKVRGYTLGKVIERPELDYHSDMMFGRTEVYELDPDRPLHMIDYELWVSVMEGEDYYYLISLLTPSRVDEFDIWANNTEAYRQIVASVRRYNNQGKQYDFLQ